MQQAAQTMPLLRRGRVRASERCGAAGGGVTQEAG